MNKQRNKLVWIVLLMAIAIAVGAKMVLDKRDQSKPVAESKIPGINGKANPAAPTSNDSSTASAPQPTSPSPHHLHPMPTDSHPDAPDATSPTDPEGDIHTIYASRTGAGLIGEEPSIGPPPYRLRWKYVADAEQHPSIDTAATITPDTVYVADDRGTVHAIDLRSGKGKWKYVSDSGFDTTPLVTNSHIFIGDVTGLFHCISTDGTKAWIYDTQSGGVHGSANSDGDKILFGTDSAQIFCLDQNGKMVWTANAEDRINSAPSIAVLPDGRKVALFSGCDSQLRAIDLNGGKEVFASDMGALAPGSPVVVGNRIVVGVDQGHLLCFGTDGKLIWDDKDFRDSAMVFSTPAVSASHDMVVVGARDRLVHAVKLSDGSPIWTFATHGEVNSSPIISGNRVYTASQDKNIYVLDLLTGKELWKYTAARAIDAPPTVAQGVFVISDTRGNVYCFESDNR